MKIPWIPDPGPFVQKDRLRARAAPRAIVPDVVWSGKQAAGPQNPIPGRLPLPCPTLRAPDPLPRYDCRMKTRSTTILCVRRGATVAMAGDGQVTFGDMVMKHRARKVRRIHDDSVLAGFAGSAADAFALLERFEARLKDHSGDITRAAVELAREWRMDRALRRLESLITVADRQKTLLVSGSGDVIEPDDGVIGIGSGGAYAAAAARALLRHTELPAERIATEALGIAADICIHTNHEIRLEVLA